MHLSSQLKNIIFDLGNVVVDIDLTITYKHFMDMGWKGDENFLDKSHQMGFFKDYEQGIISSSEFVSQIQALTVKNNSISEIENAWNAIIHDYNKERIECILALKEKYRVFLLSNTNMLHIEYCQNKVPIAGSLNALFHKTYYSYELGISKPSVEIYDRVLKDANIKASETLFLDDSDSNLKSAATLGIHTWLINNPNNWVGKIAELLD